jgi:hypothetical protein
MRLGRTHASVVVQVAARGNGSVHNGAERAIHKQR